MLSFGVINLQKHESQPSEFVALFLEMFVRWELPFCQLLKFEGQKGREEKIAPGIPV